MNRPAFILACIGLLLAGCGPPSADPSMTVSEAGDTIVLAHDASIVEVTPVVHIRVMNDGSEFERPTRVMRLGNQFVLADRYRWHHLDGDGSTISSFGSRGQAPDEFGVVSQIGVRGDSVFILDANNRRYSIWTTNGFIETKSLLTFAPYPSVVNGGLRMAIDSSTITYTATTGLGIDAHGYKAILTASRTTNMIVVADTVPDLVNTFLPSRMVVPVDPLGIRALTSVNGPGEFATSDGVMPCVTVSSTSNGGWQYCDDREPVARGRYDLGALGLDPDVVAQLDELSKFQKISEHLPMFDAIELLDSGELWLRWPDAALERIHPEALRYLASEWSPTRLWTRVTLGDRSVETVAVPRTFSPQVILEDRLLLGLMANELGEIQLVSLQLGLFDDGN